MVVLTQQCLACSAEKEDMFASAEALLKSGLMCTDMKNFCGKGADDNSRALFDK